MEEDDHTKGSRMFVVFDLLFYALLPYFIWAVGRHTLSDYHALLLSTSPGFVYTLIRFAVERQWNVTGLFLVGTLVTSTTIDLVSGSAEAMIVNNIRTLFGFGLFFLLTMIAGRPMAAFFFADTADYWIRQNNKRSFRDFCTPEVMPYFQALTLLFALRYCFIAGAKWAMFETYGVDGYGILIWWRVALSWGFGALILLASFLVARRIRHVADL
ncbi:VC0807 family protein [Paenibacillus alkalitolerans]|uniref:VC0807 family protein n=1 Tax=Paenibacillus alkalitolerans TaxID=2799335 RepID=UPI0018F3B978|nr:VC0807 family protein [Paenibacillus alkalitolerans]